MQRSPDVVVDIAVFGGGVAGLWLLDRLRDAGYSAVLFEADRLGAGQSVASQGIIHGGAKYALGGSLGLGGAAGELKAMPAIWRDALAGRSGPNLTQAKTLSDRTYLWIPQQTGRGVLAALSRWLTRSRVRALASSEWPAALGCDVAAGAVYALDEMVLDVPSVLDALRAAHDERVRLLPGGVATAFDDADEGCARLGSLAVRAQRFVFVAGKGNEALIDSARMSHVPTQRRPLHQLMIRGMTQPLFAHCIGARSKPLATVTAHPVSADEYVWYVGGSMAEESADSAAACAVEQGRRVLPRLFPAADFGAARWATVRVDRAEASAPGSHMPGGPVVRTRGRFMAAWPTKLALAPALSKALLGELRNQGVRPGDEDVGALSTLLRPEVARPPWDEVASWR